jgi:hypothetical protein
MRINPKAQRREDKPATPNAAPLLSAPWRLGVLALKSVRAAGLVAVVSLFPTIAHAQATEAWVQRYNGPANGSDYGKIMAADAGGNVYVAGASYGGDPLYGGSDTDWATIKYPNAGVPLWTNRYNGPDNGPDSVYALAVDAACNVYVTGYSVSVASGTGYDCTTVKYSSSGVPLWTNLYIGPGSGYDSGRAVAVDTNGNVYVAGQTDGGDPASGGSGIDCLTIKYSSEGVPLWTNYYDGPGNGGDAAYAVGVDASGDVFVAGSCWTGSAED